MEVMIKILVSYTHAFSMYSTLVFPQFNIYCIIIFIVLIFLFLIGIGGG